MILFLIISVGVCLWGWVNFRTKPYESGYTITDASFVYSMGSKGTLIVDNSRQLVVVLDSQNKVSSLIRGGGTAEDTFYYTDYAVSDGTYIYLNDIRFAQVGVKIASERIIRYDMKGNYIDAVFDDCEYVLDDEMMPMQYGRITGLECKDGHVTFFYREKDGYRLYEIEGGDATEFYHSQGEIPQKGYSFAYDSSQNKIYYTSKAGELFCDDGSEIVCLMESQKVESGFPTIPWRVFCDSSGNVYYTDVGQRQINNYTTGEVLLERNGELAQSPIYYNGSCNGRIIATTDGSSVLLISADGTMVLEESSFPYVLSLRAVCILVWVCGLYVLLLAVTFFLRAVYYILSAGGNMLKVGFWTGLGVVIVSVVILVMTVGSTNANTMEKTMSYLETTAGTISANMSGEYGERIESISQIGDYGSATYNRVRDLMSVYTESAYDAGIYQYTVIYKFKDNVLYGLMDYEDTITDMQPYGIYEGSDYQRAAEEKKVITVGGEANAFGTWMYSIAPIYNRKGEVVGLIDVGTELKREKEQMWALVKQVLISVIVTVVIILLLLTEGIYLSDYFERRIRAKALGNARAEVGYVRFLTFLLFFADSFQDSFIPIVSQQLYEQSQNMSWLGGIGAALPLSLQLFFVALMGMIGGKLIDRFSIRIVLCLGFMVQMMGYVWAGSAVAMGSYLFLLAGKVLVGSGMGMAVVSLNAIAASVSDDEEKGRLFAGLNAGLLSGVATGVSIGAAIAGFLGYQGAYFGSAVIIFFCGAFAVAYVHVNNLNEKEGAERAGMSTWEFISNPQVFALLGFLVLPFLILMYFKDYMFPLIAHDQGMSETSISTVFLFCGALLIYLGPTLAEWFRKKLGGKGAIICSSAIYIAALLLFGLRPGLETAVIAVFMICLGGSFGLSNQSMYYSKLPQVERYGEGKSMGIYSLFDNMGQTLGPVIFGAMMFMGYSKAALTVGILAGILLFLFIMVSAWKKKEN